MCPLPAPANRTGAQEQTGSAAAPRPDGTVSPEGGPWSTPAPLPPRGARSRGVVLGCPQPFTPWRFPKPRSGGAEGSPRLCVAGLERVTQAIPLPVTALCRDKVRPQGKGQTRGRYRLL